LKLLLVLLLLRLRWWWLLLLVLLSWLLLLVLLLLLLLRVMGRIAREWRKVGGLRHVRGGGVLILHVEGGKNDVVALGK
jgi:hypothetical protein